jgi:DNA-binding transcriptional regulator YhcF (GntR family)
VEWSINRQNKIPYYLQLKDLIRYQISTGTLRYKQQLPTVHGLAKQIGINFETVRKAYKELESEGLVATKRGVGTYVSGSAVSKQLTRIVDSKPEAVESIRTSIRESLQTGATPAAIKQMIDEVHSELVRENNSWFVSFAECNWFQAREVSEVLKGVLGLDVRPILLKDLRNEIEKHGEHDRRMSAVITTGFHIDEVRRTIGDRPVEIEFVITNMSPETRRKLEAYPKTARFGFICRDAASQDFYQSMLTAELGIKSEMVSCTLNEKAKVARLLNSVDVLLVSPSVYETVREMAPRKLHVFNVLDRVDPMSLKVLKDRGLKTTVERAALARASAARLTEELPAARGGQKVS